MGYFKAPRKAKIKGAGLYFHCHPFRVREVLDLVYGGITAKRGVHSWLIVFLDSRQLLEPPRKLMPLPFDTSRAFTLA